MARDSGFTNEPKLPGIKEPKGPRPARRTQSAPGAIPSTPLAGPSAAGVKGQAWTESSAPPPLPGQVPPQHSPGPSVAEDWLAKVPLFLGLAGLPIVLIVFGVRRLRAARQGADLNTRSAVLSIAVGGGVIVIAIVAIVVAVVLNRGVRNPEDLAVGDCVTDKGLASGSAQDVPSVRVVGCDAPHYGQVYFGATLDSGAYPGESTIISRVDDACEAQSDRVLFYQDDPVGYLQTLFPTRDGWEVGDREFLCLVVTDGVQTFSHSVLAP